MVESPRQVQQPAHGGRSSRGPMAYRGPERRRQPRPDALVLAQMLDEVGQGMVLLSDRGYVLHLNHPASQVLAGSHPLQVHERQLRAAAPSDAVTLNQALQAARRGLRRMVQLGTDDRTVCVAVVPLAPGDGHRLTLLTLSRPQLVDAVTLQCYARLFGLSAAEARVLEALCAGHDPAAVARLHGVGLATVRTQIASLRHKTGSNDINALLRTVARLPPMVSALRQRD